MRGGSCAAIVLSGLLAALAPGIGKAANAHTQSAGSATPSAPVIRYWQQFREGWFYYKDALEGPASEEEPAHVQRRLEEMHSLEEIRKEIERLRDVAILQPSDQNVKTYLYAQKYAMDKSQAFAETWRKVVWLTPELDAGIERPMNSEARTAIDQQRRATRVNYVRNLGNQGAGLFYFYESTCPYCQLMSRTLAMLQTQYGIEIVPISLDGIFHPEFPNSRLDNGLAQSLNVTTVPALFLASPRDRTIAPIGFGALSLTEILERIELLSQEHQANVP